MRYLLGALIALGLCGAAPGSITVNPQSSVNSSGTSTVPLSAPGMTLTGSGCVTLPTGCTLCGDSAGGAVFTSPDGGAVTMPAYQLEPDGGFRWDTAGGPGTAEFVCPTGGQVYFCEQNLAGVHFNAAYLSVAYFNDWNNSGSQMRIRNCATGTTADVEIDNQCNENVDLIRGYYGDGTSLVYRVTDAGVAMPSGELIGAAATLSLQGGATPTIGTDGGPIVFTPATDVQVGVGGSTNDAVTVTPGAALSDVVTFDATGVDSTIAFQFNTKGAAGFFVNDYIFASAYEGATPGTAAVDPYGATLGGHSSNYVEVAGANAGSYPTITVAGSDADGGLAIDVPGYGGVDFTPLGSGAAPSFIGNANSTGLPVGDDGLWLGQSHAAASGFNVTVLSDGTNAAVNAPTASGSVRLAADGGIVATFNAAGGSTAPAFTAGTAQTDHAVLAGGSVGASVSSSAGTLTCQAGSVGGTGDSLVRSATAGGSYFATNSAVTAGSPLFEMFNGPSEAFALTAGTGGGVTAGLGAAHFCGRGSAPGLGSLAAGWGTTQAGTGITGSDAAHFVEVVTPSSGVGLITAGSALFVVTLHEAYASSAFVVHMSPAAVFTRQQDATAMFVAYATSASAYTVYLGDSTSWTPTTSATYYWQVTTTGAGIAY